MTSIAIQAQNAYWAFWLRFFVSVLPVFSLIVLPTGCSDPSEGSPSGAHQGSTGSQAGSDAGIGGNAGSVSTGGTGAGVCVSGFISDPQPSTPFSCGAGFEVDVSFAAFNALGDDSVRAFTDIRDLWIDRDGATYLLAMSSSSGIELLQGVDDEWNVVTEVKDAFGASGRMMKIQRIGESLCVGGFSQKELTDHSFALLLCEEGGVWTEQDLDFDPDTGCPEVEGLLGCLVKDVSANQEAAALLLHAEGDSITTYVYLKQGADAWTRQELPVLGEVDLTAAWVHSPCDVYVVGESSQTPRLPLLLHYDGSSWSELLSYPSTITFLGAVSGNENEVYIGGYANSATDDSTSVLLRSSDLVNWDTWEVQAETRETFAGSVTTPRKDAVLFGQYRLDGFGSVLNIHRISEGEMVEGYTLTAPEGREGTPSVRQIRGDGSGAVVIGAGLLDDTLLYRGTCR